MAFDPSKLQQHARKGSFTVETQKNEIDTSARTALRQQQDLLVTRLNNSKRSKKGEFRLPELCTITGKQVIIYQNALNSLGIQVVLDPTAEYSLDRTGFCPEIILQEIQEGRLTVPADYLGNSFILVTDRQKPADIINPRYSFLSRLMDDVWTEFSAAIRSFTRSEAVVGTISNVIIENGVERFLSEELYKQSDTVTVNVRIETPESAIGGMIELNGGIAGIRQKPESVTDLENMRRLFDLSIHLKNIHKKLGDLTPPQSRELSREMHGFRYGDAELELFYLKSGKPVFIFFPAGEEGGPEEIQDYFADEFVILNGADPTCLLNNLLDLQLVDFLVENIETIRDTHAAPKSGGLLSGLAAVTGKTGSGLSRRWHDLNDVVSALRLSDATELAKRIRPEYTVLGSTDDLENMRLQYVRSISGELKSQILFPRTEKEDRLICDLISLSSISDNLQIYRKSERFIPGFSSSGREQQIDMLKDIDTHLRFANQNNLLVNLWLSKAAPEQCAGAGIRFVR